jgi:hypothetical protein
MQNVAIVEPHGHGHRARPVTSAVIAPDDERAFGVEKTRERVRIERTETLGSAQSRLDRHVSTHSPTHRA